MDVTEAGRKGGSRTTARKLEALKENRKGSMRIIKELHYGEMLVICSALKILFENTSYPDKSRGKIIETWGVVLSGVSFAETAKDLEKKYPVILSKSKWDIVMQALAKHDEHVLVKKLSEETKLMPPWMG